MYVVTLFYISIDNMFSQYFGWNANYFPAFVKISAKFGQNSWLLSATSCKMDFVHRSVTDFISDNTSLMQIMTKIMITTTIVTTTAVAVITTATTTISTALVQLRSLFWRYLEMRKKGLS